MADSGCPYAASMSVVHRGIVFVLFFVHDLTPPLDADRNVVRRSSKISLVQTQPCPIIDRPWSTIVLARVSTCVFLNEYLIPGLLTTIKLTTSCGLNALTAFLLPCGPLTIMFAF